MKELPNFTVETLLSILPKKTHNCEPFGLMLMIDGDGERWTVCYYSHFSKKRDDRFPVMIENSPKEVLEKMYYFIKANYSDMLNPNGLKRGDKIIWDSGSGYEIGTFIESSDFYMYNSVKVNLESGVITGETLRPKHEVKPYSDELVKELTNKYTYLRTE